MLKRTLMLLAGGATCFAGPAFAQAPDQGASQKALAEKLSAKVDAIAGGASNDATLKRNPTPNLQLLATADDKVASLDFTLDLRADPPDGKMVKNQLSFTASSQLDDSGDARLLGLKGFGKGTEIKAAFTSFSARVRLPETPDTTQEDIAVKNCLATSEGQAKPEVCQPDQYGSGAGAFVAAYNPGGYLDYIDQFSGPPIFLGVELAGNQADYDYLDRTAFATKSESHFGYKATLFGGGLFSGRNGSQTAVTASYTWGRAYEETEEITLCQPLAGGVQSQCLTAKDGAPGKQDLSVWSVEIRHAFGAKIGEYAKVAVAPEFSYDAESQAYSVTLPLYLVGDDKGKLRGGLRAVYLNQKQAAGGRDEEYALGVFVGVPFTLFSR